MLTPELFMLSHEKEKKSRLIKSTTRLSDIYTAQIADEVGILLPQAHVLFGMWCIYLASTLVRLANENVRQIPPSFPHSCDEDSVPSYWYACHLVRCLDDNKSLTYMYKKAIRDGSGFEKVDPSATCLLTHDFVVGLVSRAETYLGEKYNEDVHYSLVRNIKASMSSIFYRKNLRVLLQDLSNATIKQFTFSDTGTDGKINLMRASRLSCDAEEKIYIRSHGFQQFGFMRYHPCDLFSYRYTYVEYFVRYMHSLNRNLRGLNVRFFWHLKLILKALLLRYRKKLKFKNNCKKIVFLTYWTPNGQYPWDNSLEIVAQKKLICDAAREAYRLGWQIYIKPRPEEQLDNDYLTLCQEISAEVITTSDIASVSDALFIIPSVSSAIVEYSLAGFDFLLLAIDTASHWWLSNRGRRFFKLTGLNLGKQSSIQEFKRALLCREGGHKKVFKKNSFRCRILYICAAFYFKNI
jgi:hypothetical protein